MNVYLDASALVKRYVVEAESAQVVALIGGAQMTATALLCRAEVAAALAKAVRVGLVARESAVKSLGEFNADWEYLIRLHVGEPLIARAAMLAWEHGLRGYDAVHLATALAWCETLGEAVTVATYDRELWRGAREAGLSPWPAAISG